MKISNRTFAILSLCLFFCVASVAAQTTEFTYQGRLLDNTLPPTASYDFEFKLYDALTGGSFVGLRTRMGVQVTNGVFTVQLDFLPSSFNGNDRFLDILVKPAGSSGGYQQLLPRQPITHAPYSFHSLNAETAAFATNSQQLGGIAANQYVQTSDSRLSDARPPTAGSGNYVQNRTSQQATTNFNISGDGTAAGSLNADIVRATTHYGLDGVRVLSTPGLYNVFVGPGTGVNLDNLNGIKNSFFGNDAGNRNVDGDYNSFFGMQAGIFNTSGDENSFFGYNAGELNTSGLANTFVGNEAGRTNGAGHSNTILGAFADLGGPNLNFATAIGATAVVTTSNTIVLGSSSETVIVPGKLEVDTLGGAGNTAICLNASNRVGTCSSSLRYKTNLATYSSGLNILNRLRPITFDWKEGGMHDLGLGAEDVEKIDPLLVTYNKQGQVEGVKYDRIGVVLVNAVNEQQAEIERQKQQIQRQDEKIVEQGRQIGEQQRQLEVLKKLVCLSNPQADVCK